MEKKYLTTTYDYQLPPELIAQEPKNNRDKSRLLTLNCTSDAITHHHFSDILTFLRKGDVMVVNDTKVFPARLHGHKETGGKVEILLLNYPEKKSSHLSSNVQNAKAIALVKSSKRPRPGTHVTISNDFRCEIVTLLEDSKVEIDLHYSLEKNSSLEALLEKHGEMPLPPYIQRPQGSTRNDTQRYQTKFATNRGAVAAPTAGLHFSNTLLDRIKNRGVDVTAITLHVGYGTFSPVRSTDIRDHKIHSEYIEIRQQTADIINLARKNGNRIWAIGTTTVRSLEYAANSNGRVKPVSGWCDFYIYPGYQFKVIDNLITNFHLPQSSLLFLVSALAGRQRIARCYEEAVENKYRFFSYGDAMAIITTP